MVLDSKSENWTKVNSGIVYYLAEIVGGVIAKVAPCGNSNKLVKKALYKFILNVYLFWW